MNESSSQFDGYDLIGDVHGCAHTLEKLLLRMGYEKKEGVYKHPRRQAIFVGDIVDRGPRIREGLHIIKNMVDAGAAQCVLGNHEYNALGYTTPLNEGCDGDSVYVKAHNTKNNRLITDTLLQFAGYPEEWRMFLQWFRELPLFLEFETFRVVHACWDQDFIDELRVRGYSNRIDDEFIRRSADSSSFESRCVDRLTRGTDIKLPEGRAIESSDGYTRRFFRTKFWASTPKDYQDVVFQPDPLPEDLKNQPLSEVEQSRLLSYGKSEKPVFIGHYWLTGAPKVLKSNIACLDYSAVKYGRLVAYRFDGEQVLDNSNFVWEYVNPDHLH